MGIMNAIDLALALLNHSLGPESLSYDLWAHLADENHKINELSQFLSPVGGSSYEVAILNGCVPNLPPLTWENVARKFENSELLMGLLKDWTIPFYVELLIPMKAKERTPMASDGSTASRSTNLKQKILGFLSVNGVPG
ncbi:uncharacterized protein V1513DRAFT_453368 [Lipomyces chichibuensis]|uniref:uncharacterized protein n=1 Tax=Lipomyces chichibuensis TaxID=1546026 RepID=UPI003343C03A